MKNKIINKIVILNLVLLAFLSAIFLPLQICQASPIEYGFLKVKVTSQTGQPMINAQVFIPEISQSFFTDDDGFTPSIKIPMTQDNRFIGICKKDFAEITLYVTLLGHTDTLVTSTVVRKNLTRMGPTVALNPSSPQIPFIAYQDYVDQKWAENFIAKFRNR